jgi:5'-3' exonuclease
VILIDYNQVAISSFFNVMKDSNDDEDYEDLLRHVILNVIRTHIHKNKKRFGSDVIICVDGRHSWRKKVFPYYKAQRKISRKESTIDWPRLFASMAKITNELREYFPYKVIEINEVEADDVIATLVRQFPDQENLILSSDKDFIQLQGYTKNVFQYDIINSRWLMDDDPVGFLYSHIMSGDSTDGIPNILSDDDTFVVDSKRQKKLGEKKISEWKLIPLTELLNTEPLIANYNRNKRLIDLRFCPKDLKQAVVESYNSQINKQPSGTISNYLMKFQLVNLLPFVGEFK